MAINLNLVTEILESSKWNQMHKGTGNNLSGISFSQPLICH